MEKQLVSLNQDYILETFFLASSIKDENGNNKTDWISESREIANGFNSVDNIVLYASVFDSNGYGTKDYKRINIHATDILALASKILEINTTPTTGAYYSNLPF